MTSARARLMGLLIFNGLPEHLRRSVEVLLEEVVEEALSADAGIRALQVEHLPLTPERPARDYPDDDMEIRGYR